jgi:hypothetical protein
MNSFPTFASLQLVRIQMNATATSVQPSRNRVVSAQLAALSNKNQNS